MRPPAGVGVGFGHSDYTVDLTGLSCEDIAANCSLVHRGLQTNPTGGEKSEGGAVVTAQVNNPSSRRAVSPCHTIAKASRNDKSDTPVRPSVRTAESWQQGW